MQGKRTRALDSRGRPVPGLYTRDGRFIAGAKIGGRWTMKTLAAVTLTEARRERDGWLTGVREGRIAAPVDDTFAAVFAEHQDARSISSRTRAHEQYLLDHYLGEFKSRRIQDMAPRDVARCLRDLRAAYSEWTCVAVDRGGDSRPHR